MSVDIIHIKPEQIARIDFTDPDTGENLATLRFAYCDLGYVSLDITMHVGDHTNIRAWKEGDPLRTAPLNLQLEEGRVKGVTIFSTDERYAA